MVKMDSILITRRNRMNKMIKKLSIYKQGLLGAVGLGLGLVSGSASASAVATIGGLSKQVSASFNYMLAILSAGCYVAGVAFTVGAIMKFKAHKDNPQSAPLGTCIAVLGVGAALLFLPTIVNVAGSALFGAAPATTASGVSTF